MKTTNTDTSVEVTKRRSPFARFVSSSELTNEKVHYFKRLLDLNPTERIVDNFLNEHPELLIPIFSRYFSGNNGIWVFPQQVIRSCVRGIQNGLIPNWIVCIENSDGLSWWILELKKPTQKIFSGAGRNWSFSSYVNKGISQLLRYIDFCTEHQSLLRDALKLKGFREPKGILIIGRFEEFREAIEKKKFKSIWNRLSPYIQIRTYDFFII